MTDVEPFVRSYLEAIGATSRPLSNGALAVRWPPTHAGTFGPSTTVAFDPAVAEASRAELCVVGSDLLDRILRDAMGRGFHCVARVDAEDDPPAEEVLAANLSFRNARAEVTRTEKRAVPYELFNFRATLTTDEKVDLLRSVLLNPETLQEHAAVDIFLEESLTLPEESVATVADLAAMYRAACSALERSIQPDVAAMRAKAGAILAEELSRIEAFYDESIKELYASRTQAPLEAEGAFRAERGRRVEEARRKYALSATARLVNARTILIPTTTMQVRVSNARASRDLGLEYDAVNLEVKHLPCESCGTPSDAWYLCSRGHLACDACDRTCAFCDHVVCAKCAPEVFEACTACRKDACPDHAFTDEIGRKAYCEDHIHACAICSRMVGPPYVRACGLCGQSYCAVDVEASGRCVTCRALAAIPATHADVRQVTATKGEPRNLTKWLRGENGKFTILVGRGAVFQYLYVMDKNGAVLRRRKGVGLAGGSSVE